ncbi:unnamed protein product (mitochondrion) [Plasmodiophora brassicae]|uniref:Lipoamide acyltransferase component of branched-chain alpha-keto acid dehydrogenase complex, mitochondrial n=1 Tax=Plasmodiophora brassicae TaxID=37360 RepID=A0A3P3Y281_PLABS|nr:unnamed protein product [Plasmodiophora brassicae]
MMRCMATTMRMWVGGRVQSRWMASKVVLPSLGDSITEGEIVEIVKNVGDQVAVDDVVAIAETDKVSVDIRSSSSGVVKEVFAKPGQVIKVGDDILSIDDATGPRPSAPEPDTKKTPPTRRLRTDR